MPNELIIPDISDNELLDDIDSVDVSPVRNGGTLFMLRHVISRTELVPLSQLPERAFYEPSIYPWSEDKVYQLGNFFHIIPSAESLPQGTDKSNLKEEITRDYLAVGFRMLKECPNIDFMYAYTNWRMARFMSTKFGFTSLYGPVGNNAYTIDIYDPQVFIYLTPDEFFNEYLRVLHYYQSLKDKRLGK